MRTRTLATVVGLSVLLIGCAPAHARSSGADGRAQMAVHVGNDSWEDLAIYLMRGTARIPLGTVPSMEERRFVLVPSVIGPGLDLALLAVSRVSGRIVRSELFEVGPGSQVQWEVQPNLLQSALSIR